MAHRGVSGGVEIFLVFVWNDLPLYRLDFPSSIPLLLYTYLHTHHWSIGVRLERGKKRGEGPVQFGQHERMHTDLGGGGGDGRKRGSGDRQDGTSSMPRRVSNSEHWSVCTYWEDSIVGESQTLPTVSSVSLLLFSSSFLFVFVTGMKGEEE